MGINNLTGAWGEALAAEYLRKKRYQLLATGYKCRYGEIDLIVCNKKYLVFVYLTCFYWGWMNYICCNCTKMYENTNIHFQFMQGGMGKYIYNIEKNLKKLLT